MKPGPGSSTGIGDARTVLSDRMTGLDSVFLHLERPETPMHVGSLQICDLPAGFSGDFAQRVRDHVASRLHLLPPLRRRLAPMPFDLANPRWADADVDLAWHVRRHRLRAPGSMRQLERLVAKLHASALERDRPLWQFHVIEGLADERTVAVYSKLHHAAIDGQAGVALAAVLLDPGPEPRVIDRSPFAESTAHGDPGHPAGDDGRPHRTRDLLAELLADERMRYRELGRVLRPAAAALADVGIGAARRLGARIAARVAGDHAPGDGAANWTFGPRTPFNAAVSTERTFATTRLPLDDMRRIAEATGATVNDVVLAVCSGALRGYLERRDALPARSLIAAMPFSLRARGDARAGNQAMMSMVYLGTEIADAVERLRAVSTATVALKEDLARMKTVLPTDMPSLGLPWLLSGAWALYGRLWADARMPPIANLVISNVPGPTQPLYLAGARYRSFFPLSIVAHGLALNITVESYCDSMDFGLVACRHAVPDVERIADALPGQLDALADGVANAPVTPKTTGRRRSAAKRPVPSKRTPRTS